MDIEKLVDEITQAVFQKIQAQTETAKVSTAVDTKRRIDLSSKQFVHKTTLGVLDIKSGDIVYISSKTRVTPMAREHLRSIGATIEVG